MVATDLWRTHYFITIATEKPSATQPGARKSDRVDIQYIRKVHLQPNPSSYFSFNFKFFSAGFELRVSKSFAYCPDLYTTSMTHRYFST